MKRTLMQPLAAFMGALALSLTLVTAAYAAPVNVNTADAKTIAKALDGVGMAKAEAIVQYREDNGFFETAEELIKVEGIGRKTLEANLDDIKVEVDDN